ncbi:pantoate--beta-alanine ligase [Sporosarcina aquimarina]|uniref:Pantothenate synthetase n=1 Tax=Sporosarcina aquimarina TaxID=114975 RepID=A0ABU4G083_9BACL|nr:pantoate--beta-alanine ligase [Sporosarcina aquimarina]MDW0109057.1 pantoate--beta-alanine ligase [Sporosarcina aquimarina]
MTETHSMQCTTSILVMKEWQSNIKAANQTIGFVPTMGFLHDGHLKLIEEAKKSYDYVAVSIFVNPTQFGPSEDFDAYPRNLNADVRLAAQAGADIVFCPEVIDMYPEDSGIRILPGPLANRLCGVSRPGHFDGVLQVVLKLVNIVQPDAVFFGMKDAQQLAIIESFFIDFNFSTRVVRVPTVREQDGLAKSSRNVNLTVQERTEAPLIYAVLQQAVVLCQEGVSSKEIERFVKETLEKKTSGTIDYVSLLTYPKLESPTDSSADLIIACALQFSKARLIDNILFKKEG